MSFPPGLPPEMPPEMGGMPPEIGGDPGMGLPPGAGATGLGGMGGLAELASLNQPQEPLDGAFAPPDTPTRRDQLAATTVPDYTLPVVEAGRKPSVDWIIRQREARIAYQQERNLAMLADEQMYVNQVQAKQDGDGGEEVIISNIASASINKLCFMVGRQDDKIVCEPRSEGEEYRVAAQIVEDFLYDANRHADRRYRASGNQGLAHDETYYASVRGWLAWRVSIDPESESFQFVSDLKDPFNCYPAFGQTGGGFMRNMIYYEETTVAAFLSDNPEHENSPYFRSNVGDPLDDDQQLKVTWYEDSLYTIVVLDADRGAANYVSGAQDVFGSDRDEGPLYGGGDDEDNAPAPYILVDEKHEYGFCPWAMVPCNGTPNRVKASRGMNGAGLLRQNRGVIAAFNRLLSQIHSDHAQASNPASIDSYGGPDAAGLSVAPAPLSTKPGARNFRDKSQGQESEIIQARTRPDTTALLYEEYTKQLDRGLILPVLWGTTEGSTGGFHMAVAKNSAEDSLFPVTDAIISARQMRNELLLNLVLAAERLNLINPSTIGRPGERPSPGVRVRRRNRGKRRFEQSDFIWGVLQPEHIHRHGVGNTVKLRRLTPQDLTAMVQSAVVASQSKVLSLDWVRQHWLDIDDPTEMNEWIIYESTLSDPEVMRMFHVPRILERYDPALAQWFQEKLQAEAMAAAGGPPGQGTPPGQLPPGAPPEGPGGNPPGLGVDNAQLPSDMQTTSGMPGSYGDPEQLMAMIDQIIAQGGQQ